MSGNGNPGADEESGMVPMETEKLLNNDYKQGSAGKEQTKQVSNAPTPAGLKAAEFAFSFFGLIISYVTWGVMQELIMSTHFHPTPLVPSGMFPSSTFCVFSNRALAIVVAFVACIWRHGSVQSAASWLSFSPPALSNTVSSWAQYESLAYVSFPLQNLFKSTKLIPVMIMGRLLNGTVYSFTEIAEALVISGGVLVFSMGKGNSASGGETTSVHGLLLLCTYVVADSFTSQYQSSIYKKYGKIDQFHMMFGVNLSAITITSFALLVGGEIPEVIQFLYYNPVALFYNIITAVSSATGQLFIFYTIKTFGPVVFTIIMTTRQIVSMIVSTIYFHHPMPWSSVLGASIVFCAVFHSVYRQMQKASSR